ncbi:hypothetical protein GF324_12615, partial [bacterium]|nr:hypothetical protein [bacterium]
MKLNGTKLLIAVCLLLAGQQASAFDLVEISPAYGTELTYPEDPIRLVFDEAPDTTRLRENAKFTGTYRHYPVWRYWTDADTLFIVPKPFFLAGDRVTLFVDSLYAESGAALEDVQSVFWIRGADGDPENMHTEETAAPVPSTPRSHLLHDLNQDCYPDFAYVDNYDIFVYENAGLSSDIPFDFTSASWSSQASGIPACDGPRVLETADLDNDGYPDLITSDYWNNTLHIFRNVTDANDHST